MMVLPSRPGAPKQARLAQTATAVVLQVASARLAEAEIQLQTRITAIIACPWLSACPTRCSAVLLVQALQCTQSAVS